jgi:hypothetical protein
MLSSATPRVLEATLPCLSTTRVEGAACGGTYCVMPSRMPPVLLLGYVMPKLRSKAVEARIAEEGRRRRERPADRSRARGVVVGGGRTLIVGRVAVS